jgi:Cysteine rich repeat
MTHMFNPLIFSPLKFNPLKNVARRDALLAAALFAIATPALAQAPTDAQKSAIRSACRSDYQAHCSSVTPGGAEALQCLQKNMSSLSSACQSAVRAIEPAAAPKTEAAPAAPKAESAPASPAAEPAAKPAATTAAPKAAPTKQPGSAQVSAIRSACRSDYPKVCAGVQPGGAAALECLEKNKAKVSPACEKAVSAASGGGAATAAAPADTTPAAAPAAAPTVIMLRPLRPREELFIVRSACGGDVRTLCAGVAPGGGRIAQCLATNAASLSPACKDVLAPFAAR